MKPGAERNYWAAVSALREAESLAQLSSVSGPADEPPRDGDEPSWIEDWSKRAHDALKKAREWADSKKRALRDRASRIAEHVRTGARRIYQASPIGKTAKALQSVNETANHIQLAAWVTSVGLTLALLAGAWWLFKQTKART